MAPSGASMERAAAPWKVAGIGLGMTPAEVALAVKEDGYQLVRRSQGRSWQGQVANQVRNLRSIKIQAGSQVITNEQFRVGQEQILVTYTAGRAGPYVSQLDYFIDFEAIEADNFRRAVLVKYGTPSVQWQSELLYCAAGETVCKRTGSLSTNQLPNLTVYIANASRRGLHLRQGERADKAYWAAVRAEAERLYPKKDKPNF